MALKDWRVYSNKKEEMEWINRSRSSAWMHGKTVSIHKKREFGGWLSTSSLVDYPARILPSKNAAIAHALDYMRSH